MADTTSTRCVTAVLILALLLPPSGCATMFAGQPKNVRVLTYPAGGTVLYQGMTLQDGETVVVNKRFETPSFYLDARQPFARVEMTYDPSAWLIADGALLFVFVIPGLVALGVDFGTGAWRDVHEVQTVIVPRSDSAPAKVAGKGAAEEP